MLEKFVISLGKEYIPIAKKIAQSSEEAGARARVAWNDLRISIGKQLIPIGEQFQEIGIQIVKSILPVVVTISQAMIPAFKAIAGIIEFVVNNFHALASIMAVVGAGFAAAAIQATGFTAALAIGKIAAAVKAIGGMVFALKAMTLAQWKANIAAYANPYVALAAGLTAATIAAYRFATASDRLKAKLSSGDATEEDVTKALKRRLEIQRQIRDLEANDSKRGGASRANRLKKLKEEYAELTQAIEDFRKAVEDGASIEELMKKALEMSSMGGKDGEDKSPFQKWTDDAFKFKDQVENAVISAFEGMEDALVKFAQTGKLEFKSLVQSILADLLKIAIRATITKPLMQGLGLLADGGVIAGNNIVPYRKGGVVGAPTMFRYGGSKLGIMGEAGPEAIMPLKRGPSGKLGVEMHGGRGGGGVTTVNYTGPTLNFNGDEYVPRSAVSSIINSAASKGAAAGQDRTMASLRNSRSNRSRLGM